MPQLQEIQATSDMIRALIDVQSVNTESRTFEVVYATETPVLRSPWWGDSYNEVLSMDGMREGRMDKGAPLLDNHNRHGSVTENVLGVVQSHTRNGNERRAVIKLSKSAVERGIMENIQDGIYRNVSVGYSVYKYVEVPRVEGDEVPTYRAVDWEAGEISLVPVGADENSGVRSQSDAPRHTLVIERAETPEQKPNTMPIENEGVQTPQTAETPQERGANTPAPNPQPSAVDIAKAERERISSIQRTAEALGLERSFYQPFIDGGNSFVDTHKRLLEEYEKADPAKGISNTQQTVSVQNDERDNTRAMMTGALLARGMARGVELTDIEKEGERQFQRLSLVKLAERSLEADGIDTQRMNSMDLVKRAITQSTSDFPVVLDGTLRRTLLAEYMLQADTWRRFCITGTMSDFREYKRLRTGSLSDLQVVNENGEYKFQKIGDAEFERNQLQTYGTMINLSRQAIINDDLGEFMRLAGKLGRASARTIENTVYALLLQNGGLGPTLQDGAPMFDATHNNIDTVGELPSVESFSRMRTLMGKQKDVNENDFLSIRPEVGLFPLELEDSANLINRSQYDPSADNKSSFRPNLSANTVNEVVGTPRLSGTRYYMFNTSEDPCFEVGFLNGQETPFIDMEEGFYQDGMVWKIRHDFGAAGIGYRGGVTNPGA